MLCFLQKEIPCGETEQARPPPLAAGRPGRPDPRPSLATEVPVPAPLSGSLQEPGDLPPSPGSIPFHIST